MFPGLRQLTHRVLAGEPSTRLLVIVGLCVGILTWNLGSIVPTSSLDASWRTGLYLALERGLQFGSQIDFTFGPLGFLVHPLVVNPALGFLAWTVTGALHLALCVAVALLTKGRGSWLFKVWFIALGSIAALYLDNPLAASCLMLLFLLARSPRTGSASGGGNRDVAVAAIAGAAGAIGTMVKLNDGLVIVTLGIAIAASGARRIAGLAAFGALFGSAFLLVWFGTGQRLSDVPGWIGTSREFVAGYSSAMATPGVERFPWLDGSLMNVVVALAAFIASSLVWQYLHDRPRFVRLVLFCAFAGFLFVGYKEGTVRHAPFTFFASLFIVVAWIPVRLGPMRLATGRGVRAAVFAVASLAVLVALQFDIRGLNPIERVTTAVAQLDTFVDARVREATIDTARQDMRASFGVPPAMIERIGAGTVHVAPYDAGVIWAHPGLNWLPLPVFQQYSAYTAELDSLNARSLTSADGPAYVLRRPNATIDGRSEWYEAPDSMLALACNFREVLTEGRWQLLERRPNRCSAPTLIAQVSARPGDLVQVPAASDPDLVITARIGGLDADPLSRIRAVLASGLTWSIELSNGGTYRLVPGTAGGPLIVAAQTDAVYPGKRGPPSIDGFTLLVGDDIRVPFAPQPEATLTIVFEGIRISP